MVRVARRVMRGTGLERRIPTERACCVAPWLRCMRAQWCRRRRAVRRCACGLARRYREYDIITKYLSRVVKRQNSSILSRTERCEKTKIARRRSGRGARAPDVPRAPSRERAMPLPTRPDSDCASREAPGPAGGGAARNIYTVYIRLKDSRD